MSPQLHFFGVEEISIAIKRLESEYTSMPIKALYGLVSDIVATFENALSEVSTILKIILSKNPNITAPITCVIIDDDPFISDLLKDKLTEHFPEIQVIAIAKNGQEGMEILMKIRPKLVFMEVEMNDMTGFEMLLKLPDIYFKTIFITSYRHYAIQAIRFNALDYLLKPINLEELKNAIARFKTQDKDVPFTSSIRQALENCSALDVKDTVLILNLQEGLLKVDIKNILHIQGDRNYSLIHLANNKVIVSKTLSNLASILDNYYFFRCHKSHLVNRIHVKSLINRFSLSLSSGISLPISRRRKQPFQDWLDQIPGK
jgi:two-component system, LytTR family, response regulator